MEVGRDLFTGLHRRWMDGQPTTWLIRLRTCANERQRDAYIGGWQLGFHGPVRV
jgi:hypothetical protein